MACLQRSNFSEVIEFSYYMGKIDPDLKKMNPYAGSEKCN